LTSEQLKKLAYQIKNWARNLGFQQAGITDTDLQVHEKRLNEWLLKGMHGTMTFMSLHGSKRTRPEELLPGTIRVISVRMDYWPQDGNSAKETLNNKSLGYVSRYATGRDYHKLMRKRLQRLADQIQGEIGEFGYRAFVDSAPVMEKALAEKAGLGWIGKHSNLINQNTGSWFFLGELYTDLPLPVDSPAENHCGTCTNCLVDCPTNAIVAPYQVDARRCISYLTIENKDAIPLEFRKAMGNRIYGCDDCQLVCPWNRFTKNTLEPDFAIRNRLDQPELVKLFLLSEEEFLTITSGSAIRRIGYQAWLRNIAVALGNAPSSEATKSALRQRLANASTLVREHIEWALHEQEN